MFQRITAGLAVAALATAPLTVAATSAEAARPVKHYGSCDALHRDYPHGVAKSVRAANKAVRDGYGRPSTSKKAKQIYANEHNNLDRDDDGTACEA